MNLLMSFGVKLLNYAYKIKCAHLTIQWSEKKKISTIYAYICLIVQSH